MLIDLYLRKTRFNKLKLPYNKNEIKNIKNKIHRLNESDIKNTNSNNSFSYINSSSNKNMKKHEIE